MTVPGTAAGTAAGTVAGTVAGTAAGTAAGADAGTARTWDLIVVGAGPAGAATALGALAEDPSLRVLLLDRAEFPRDKSCGDGIAPHVFDALAQVGVHDVAQGWTPLRRLRLSRGEASVTGELARPVWVIPRVVFDARLVAQARSAGATFERRRVRTVAVRDDGTVAVDGDLAASVVVGADGAQSVVRAAARSVLAPRRALAVRGYAPTRTTMRGQQVIVYGDRRQPAYAWAFDRGDGLANVGYGELVNTGNHPPTRALMLAELERLIPGAAAHGGQWRGHHLPLSGFGWRQCDGPVLLAGDAAGLVNPMTGEGIYYAVATGISAGRAASQAIAAGVPASAGARHHRAVRRLLGRHLRHTWAASRLSAHAVVVAAGIRAADRSPAVFDDLVELGLGRGTITPRALVGLAMGIRG